MNFFRDPDFISTVRQRTGRVIAGVTFLVGRSVFGVYVPVLLGRATNAVIDGAGRTQVMIILGELLGVSVVTALCQYWMRWLLICVSRDVELVMREGLFRHLLSLSWPFFNRSRTGDLMSRLTSDIESVRMGIGPGVMYLLDTALRTIGAVAMMASLSPRLTGFAIIPMIGMFFGLRKLLRELHDLSLRVQEEQGEISTRVQESFSGARVIKAFGREGDELVRFRGISEKYADLNVRLAKVRALLGCVIEMGGGAILTVVLLIGGWQVLDRTLTVGDMVSFIAYLQMLVWPMIAVGWVMSLWQRAEASESRLQTVRAEKPEIVDAPHPRTPALVRGHVEIRHLTFRHPDAAEPVLRDLNVDIPAGTSLGIVGRTGSGKTTIANLVPRLLDPPPGTVLVDGTDVRDWSLAELRRAIGIVPQETFLFSDTIESNVTFGADALSPEVVAESVRRSALDEAIATFPDGLQTVVGERGVTLSGGQRQRTAIARALAIDPPILILDDCLSAVDAETEARVLSALRDVIRTRTTIVISHRLAAMTDMDQVIVLDDGRVVEHGTHLELLQNGGLYAELARLQEIEAGMETET